MSELPLQESRVYARHSRLEGAVLIIGAGAVGGFLAEELARRGASPICLVDFDRLDEPNLPRHPLGRADLGNNKAIALAARISEEFSLCDARGIDANYLELSEDAQLQLAHEADVVVVAVESVACRERANYICLRDGVPAVYPTLQLNDETRDVELGEILWVLPEGLTPCYSCAVRWRDDARAGGTSRATRTDIMTLVLAATSTVAALLNPDDEESHQFLDVEHTCMFFRGLRPLSDASRALFRNDPVRYAQVPFPPTPCRICGGQAPPSPELVRLRQEAAERELAEATRRHAAELAALAEQARLSQEAAVAARQEALENMATELLEGPFGLMTRYWDVLAIERDLATSLSSPRIEPPEFPLPPPMDGAPERAVALAALLRPAVDRLHNLIQRAGLVAAQRRDRANDAVRRLTIPRARPAPFNLLRPHSPTPKQPSPFLILYFAIAVIAAIAVVVAAKFEASNPGAMTAATSALVLAAGLIGSWSAAAAVVGGLADRKRWRQAVATYPEAARAYNQQVQRYVDQFSAWERAEGRRLTALATARGSRRDEYRAAAHLERLALQAYYSANALVDDEPISRLREVLRQAEEIGYRVPFDEHGLVFDISLDPPSVDTDLTDLEPGPAQETTASQPSPPMPSMLSVPLRPTESVEATRQARGLVEFLVALSIVIGCGLLWKHLPQPSHPGPARSSALSAYALSAGDSIRVDVNSRADLTQTYGVGLGRTVRQGQAIHIAAVGTITYGLQDGGFAGCNYATGEGVSDPDGHLTIDSTVCTQKQYDSRCVLPQAPLGALIARIGSGPWFLIGSSYTAPTSGSGPISFGVNDWDYTDNANSYEVLVTAES